MMEINKLTLKVLRKLNDKQLTDWLNAFYRAAWLEGYKADDVDYVIISEEEFNKHDGK